MSIRSFSKHCEAIGFPLRNIRWSWAAASSSGSKVLFTVWEDEIVDGRYVIYPVTERRPGKIPLSANDQLGAREARRLAEKAISDRQIEAYGIRCEADDIKQPSRRRACFDQAHLIRLFLEIDSRGFIIAVVGEKISIHQAS